MDRAARGAAAIKNSNYDEAVKEYSAAIAANPSAVDYYIKRATAYQRLNPPGSDAALNDADTGLLLANRRCVRELVIQAQMRRAISCFQLERYGDAMFLFEIVKKMDEKEKSVPIWEKKVQMKLQDLDESDERRIVTILETPEANIPDDDSRKSTVSACSTPKINSAVPQDDVPVQEPVALLPNPPDKVKHDWYQTPEYVCFTLYVKNIPKDQAIVDIQSSSVSISFPTQSSSTFDFSLGTLFAAIDPERSSYIITPYKFETTLKKSETGLKWGSLEKSAAPTSCSNGVNPVKESDENAAQEGCTSFPASSEAPTRGRKDWDKVVADLDKTPTKEDGITDEDGGGDPSNAFFRMLYRNADVNTRRAMVKSFQESNGTSLSTNWEEVKKGPVKTQPPDGMEAKKWSE